MSLKKYISFFIALCILSGIFGIYVFAENAEKTPAKEVTVYVSLAVSGENALAYEEIKITDTDGDGKLTVSDALFRAHENNYEGGAAAGYRTEKIDGITRISMLWGDESGAYGLRVNDLICPGVMAPVTEGEHIYAYVYTDKDTLTDSYCFFDTNVATVTKYGKVTLLLTSSETTPDGDVSDIKRSFATITVNGKETEYKTDEEGSVTVRFDEIGTYTVSIKSNEYTVPPVCTVYVVEAPDYTWLATGIAITAVILSAVAMYFAGKGIEKKKKAETPTVEGEASSQDPHDTPDESAK